jgi:hypothetical protein
MARPMTERISMIWNTFSSREASLPEIAMSMMAVSDPIIHSAAFRLDCSISMFG